MDQPWLAWQGIRVATRSWAASPEIDSPLTPPEKNAPLSILSILAILTSSTVIEWLPIVVSLYRGDSLQYRWDTNTNLCCSRSCTRHWHQPKKSNPAFAPVKYLSIPGPLHFAYEEVNLRKLAWFLHGKSVFINLPMSCVTCDYGALESTSCHTICYSRPVLPLLVRG